MTASDRQTTRTRLAAGEPTARLGLVERILIYSSLLWVAVLAVALLRRLPYRTAESLP